MSDGYEAERRQLVERIRASVRPKDPRVLEAFMRVPRHLFVPESHRSSAYEDRALPLAEEQTVSQPSMIAIMLSALDARAGQRALEVGAGSGYAAALLAELVDEVHAVEIRPELAAAAAARLAAIGQQRVHIHLGDGRQGWPERAPYDRILVSAGADVVPPALIEQLAIGGRIAIPVGDEAGQTLKVGVKGAAGKVDWTSDVACVFVPLVRG